MIRWTELISSHFKSYFPFQDRGTRGYQTVYQPCCSERSLPGKAIRVPQISFHWVGSASAPQWHRLCYGPRRNHWSSTFGSELCIRYCWPHLTAVDPWVSIFGHRTVTGMVPLILDGPCTGVYYSVQSDFPDTTNIRYPPGLRPWSNNVYQL